MSRVPHGSKYTGLVLNCKPFEPMQLTLLTWKRPGCLDVFVRTLLFCQLMSSNGQISRYKCLTKYLIFLQPQAIWEGFVCPKFVFDRGSAPDPAGGAHDAPPDSLVG